MDFIAALEHLVFDPEASSLTREREHLHRMLEREFWVFGEQYNMMISERSLTAVLDRHLSLLGRSREDKQPVTKLDSNKIFAASGVSCGKPGGRLTLISLRCDLPESEKAERAMRWQKVMSRAKKRAISAYYAGILNQQANAWHRVHALREHCDPLKLRIDGADDDGLAADARQLVECVVGLGSSGDCPVQLSCTS